MNDNDLEQIVYDPHHIDIRRLTMMTAKAYPSNNIVTIDMNNYEKTKLFIYIDNKEYELYRKVKT